MTDFSEERITIPEEGREFTLAAVSFLQYYEGHSFDNL